MMITFIVGHLYKAPYLITHQIIEVPLHKMGAITHFKNDFTFFHPFKK